MPKTSLLLACRVLPLLPLMLCGCNGITAEQRTWLHEAKTAYDEKEYSHAIESSTRFLEQVMDGPEAMQALYYKGLSEAYLDRRERAYADLGHAVTMQGTPTLGWRTHAALGSLYFEDQEWQKSKEHYREAAAIMPKLPPKDLVLYRAALSAERCGDWETAEASYQQLIVEFPGTESANVAERRMQSSGGSYAVKAGEFAVPENADNMLFDLERQGLKPRLLKDRRGITPVYVVLLGQYKTKEEAEAAATQLRETIPAAEVWP